MPDREEGWVDYGPLNPPTLTQGGPTTKPPTAGGSPRYRVHVMKGRGAFSRHDKYGPLDAQKCIYLVGQVLGNPRVERVVFVRVRE